MTKAVFCSRGYSISYNPAYLKRDVLMARLGRFAVSHRMHSFEFRDISSDNIFLVLRKSGASGHWLTGPAILSILGVDCVTETAVNYPFDVADYADVHGDT